VAEAVGPATPGKPFSRWAHLAMIGAGRGCWSLPFAIPVSTASPSIGPPTLAVS
jgi:hypothetical protein